MDNLRKSVMSFAEEMERILKINDCKGGWDNETFYYLNRRLIEELAEYLNTLPVLTRKDLQGILDLHIKITNSQPVIPKEQAKELVDISNFCMMLHEKISKNG